MLTSSPEPLTLIAASLVAFSGLLGCHARDMASEEVPPNILLIFVDDLGYGDIGCDNPGAIRTPRIDRLASEGIRFTDAHSPSTVCSPSRYGLMTGQMQFRVGSPGVFAGMGGPRLIADERLTLPQLLRDESTKPHVSVSSISV